MRAVGSGMAGRAQARGKREEGRGGREDEGCFSTDRKKIIKKRHAK